MDKVGLLVQRLEDAPLTENKRELFVNREEELNLLSNFSKFSVGGIFGVASETGMGKTSLFHLFDSGGYKKLLVTITEKGSKMEIIADLVYKLASILEKNEKLREIARSAKKFILEEISSESNVDIGGNLVISGKLSHGKSRKLRFNVYSLKERLQKLISSFLFTYKRCVLVVDEIDKEKKEDVIVILDSLKDILNVEGLVVIFALPFTIYREYVRDRLHKGEFGNLENILREIVFLEPMSQNQIEELIWRRISGFEDLIEERAVKAAARFSDGNPREALWALSRSVFIHGSSSRSGFKITESMVLNGIRDFCERALLEANLSQQQLKAVKILGDYEGSKSEIINHLKEHGLPHSTAYDIVARLEEKSVLIEGREGYRISGKFLSVLSKQSNLLQ
ncbi:MAG: ATPase [Thermotogae bacterium]|nr:ATPase [Thermotogota bacterium]